MRSKSAPTHRLPSIRELWIGRSIRPALLYCSISSFESRSCGYWTHFRRRREPDFAVESTRIGPASLSLVFLSRALMEVELLCDRRARLPGSGLECKLLGKFKVLQGNLRGFGGGLVFFGQLVDWHNDCFPTPRDVWPAKTVGRDRCVVSWNRDTRRSGHQVKNPAKLRSFAHTTNCSYFLEVSGGKTNGL